MKKKFKIKLGNIIYHFFQLGITFPEIKNGHLNVGYFLNNLFGSYLPTLLELLVTLGHMRSYWVVI